MQPGVEFDFVVKNSPEALAIYEKVFDAERVEVTDLDQGLNEAVFTIFGTRFHILDENPEYQLFAPKPGDPKPFWFNVIVPDIESTYQKAISAGFMTMQELITTAESGMTNAIVADTCGYIWMLHQVHREVSFEERMEHWEKRQSLTG